MKSLTLFICEIICHPNRKISIWLVILLSWIIYGNVEINIDGKEMFLTSAGLVSIMTFISNYLEQQTISMEQKENFYLGFNIKKMRLYDNFWMKAFNDVPVKLFFWLTAIIPVIILGKNITYNNLILNKLFDYIEKYTYVIQVVWASIFAVSAFYCTAILIESVSLSKVAFSQNYRYKTSKRLEKNMILCKIANYFEEEFKKLFNIKFILMQSNEFYLYAESLVNYIFNRGSDVSNGEKEFNVYVEQAFSSEREAIDNLLNRIFKCSRQCGNNEHIGAIKSFYLKKTMELLRKYYNIKWNIIDQRDIFLLEFLKIVNYDLQKCLVMEKKLYSCDEYKNIFWGLYSNRRNNFVIYHKNSDESNLCMLKIADILLIKIKKNNSADIVKNIDIIINILDILYNIDEETGKHLYFSNVFEEIYSHILNINDNWDNTTKDFLDKKIKYICWADYIVNEIKIQNKKILMNGSSLSKEKIEYLIYCLPLKDIATVLIYRLAYLERTHSGVMSLEEFKVWKDTIYCREAHGETIETLNFDDFIFELCNAIGKSNVSHFVFDVFLKWLWASLFEKFDDKKYREFVELEKKRIRIDFPLSSSIILRLLLCRERYNFVLYKFDGDYNYQIKEELSKIQAILSEETYINNIYVPKC